MAKIKWAEVAKTPSKLRFETLSELLNENGFENEVEFVELLPIDFADQMDNILEKYDYLRIGSPYGGPIVKHFPVQRSDIIHLGAADAAWKVDGKWRIMSSNHFGILRIINEVGQRLDLESSVLIVGAGAGARVATSAFIKAGYKEIKITNKYIEQAQDLIEELKRKYFKVKFEFVPEDKLVMLPGSNSVLVNTTPLVPTNDLLRELYYFNFLKSTGIVIDFTFVPLDTPLILEAEQIGIKTVRGYELSSWGDMAWINQCFGLKLDRDDYCSRLREKISKIEFDMSPFIGE